MNQASYSTSSAATELQVSQHIMRRLIEAGLVDADRTEGGRWRIPRSEIARLKEEGIPPIPAPVPNPDPLPARSSPAAATPLPTLTSPAVREAADRLVIRQTELELENVEDAFRERQRRVSEIEAEQRRRQLEAEEASARKEWEERTILHALRRIPADCGPGLKLKAEEQVRAALVPYSHHSSPELIAELSAAAVEAALVPFRQQQEVQRIIDEALAQLPQSARGDRERSPWEIRLLKRFAARAEALPPHADLAALRAIALREARQVAAAFDHERRKDAALTELQQWNVLQIAAGAIPTAEEYDQAKQEAREALAAAQVGESLASMRARISTALEPLERQIRKRGRSERREQQHAQLIATAAAHFRTLLFRNYEWDSLSEMQATCDEQRPKLADELRTALESGEVEADPAAVRDWTEAWTEENITTDDDGREY